MAITDSSRGHEEAPSPAPTPHTPAKRRPAWRSVAIPAEHGGWGLTFEAALLGLVVQPSVAGVAIGSAALFAFLARTPLKLALGDRRRRRRLPRSILAERVAAVELTLLAAAVVVAVLTASAWWWVPLLAALPFFALELSFDIRSRGRRLVPELSGALGMGAVAAAIALGGGLRAGLAVGLWVVLGARAVASVPYARTQVRRVKRQSDQRAVANATQAVAVVIAVVGWAFGLVPWLAVAVLVALAVWELAAMYGPPRSAKLVGVLQMVAGLVVVGVSAAGVILVA